MWRCAAKDRRQCLVKLAVTPGDLHFLRYTPLEDTVLLVLGTELVIVLSVAARRWVRDHDKLSTVAGAVLERAEIGTIEQVHSSRQELPAARCRAASRIPARSISMRPSRSWFPVTARIVPPRSKKEANVLVQVRQRLRHVLNRGLLGKQVARDQDVRPPCAFSHKSATISTRAVRSFVRLIWRSQSHRCQSAV